NEFVFMGYACYVEVRYSVQVDEQRKNPPPIQLERNESQATLEGSEMTLYQLMYSSFQVSLLALLILDVYLVNFGIMRNLIKTHCETIQLAHEFKDLTLIHKDIGTRRSPLVLANAAGFSTPQSSD
ncbi:hypothetical protein L9F63_006791, partial [Diploptera punctata]